MLELVMAMRVIAGRLKGKTLKGPKHIRPVTSFIKEAIFNILQCVSWPEMEVLDLFAGAGNFGIEAISRGAKRVVFVDLSKESERFIEENLKGISWNGRFYRGDFREVVKKLFKKNEKFNIIFADPPFDEGLGVEVLKAIGEYNILKDNGVLVLRVRDKEKIVFPPDWDVEIRRYGDSLVYFLRWGGNAKEKI